MPQLPQNSQLENYKNQLKSDKMTEKLFRQKKFDESLCEAIDETLTSMGEPLKNTVYFNLENYFNIPRGEIPKHIDEFTDFLYKTFGLGAALFEIRCMKKLHSKIDVNIQMGNGEWSSPNWITEGMTFRKYVWCARNNYCNP